MRRGLRAKQREPESHRQVPAAKVIRRRLPPFTPFDEDNLALIERCADDLLCETGMDFRGDPESLALWRDAGADVKGERVRIERGMARHLIRATAPPSFVQHARNPRRSVEFGNDHLVFAPGYGMPFVSKLGEERHYGTLGDLDDLVKLTYLAPCLQHSGGVTCEPTDIPVSHRHLEVAYSHLRWTDKPFLGLGTSGVAAVDTIDLLRLTFGREFVDANCCTASIINVNSPLVLDHTMLEALKTYAAANQATIVTPFVMGGAMGPVTPAGMVIQVLAEALAGAALTQLVRPGAPVMIGVMLSGLNMKTGAPTRGAESWLSMLVMGQLVRRLGIPYRGGAASTSAKVVDSQAGQEAADMLLMTVLAGVNFLIHAAGHLDAGLCMSFEKFVQDCDHLEMIARFADGIDFSEDALAMDAFREIGPGQHYLSSQHTLSRYRDAFHISEVLDTGSYEQWRDDGCLTAAQRASSIWRKRLELYEPPPIDAALDASLRDFIERRKEALPASG